MTALGLTFTMRDGRAAVDGVEFPTVPAAWANFVDRVELRGARLVADKAAFSVRIGAHTFETNGRTARTGMAGRGSSVTSQYPAEAWAHFLPRADLAARRRLEAHLRRAGRDPVTGKEAAA